MSLSKEFYTKLNKISSELGMNPRDLLCVMAYESGLNPSQVNHEVLRKRKNGDKNAKGAVGLIQFMPETLKGLGVPENEIDNFGEKSAIDQLDYVKKYIKGQMNFAKRSFKSATEYYHANLFPLTLTRWKGQDPIENADVIVVSKTSNDRRERNAYINNKGLDTNNDGKITVSDLTTVMMRKANEHGFQSALAGLNSVAGAGDVTETQIYPNIRNKATPAIQMATKRAPSTLEYFLNRMNEYFSQLIPSASVVANLNTDIKKKANGQKAEQLNRNYAKDLLKPSATEHTQKALQDAGLADQSIEFRQPLHTSWQNAGPFTTTPFKRPVDGPSGKPRNHLGIDMSVSTGTPAYSIGQGTVKQIDNVSTNAMGGNAVYISHLNGKFVSYYAHLNDVRCRVGDKVDSNTIIGTCGSSGNAKSSHLHFAIYVGGVAVDPATFIGTVKYMAHYPAPSQLNTNEVSENLKFNTGKPLNPEHLVAKKAPAGVDGFLEKINDYLSSLFPSVSTASDKSSFIVIVGAEDFTTKTEYARILQSVLDEELNVSSSVHYDSDKLELLCSLPFSRKEAFEAINEVCSSVSDVFEFATSKIGGCKTSAVILPQATSKYPEMDIKIAEINRRKFKLKIAKGSHVGR